MILAALLLQVAAVADAQEARFERCADLATGDGVAGQAEATNWALSGEMRLSHRWPARRAGSGAPGTMPGAPSARRAGRATGRRG